MIGEPVLGTGGIVPPPAGYWEKVQAVLARYDVMLIADEVVTGFGRLGTMFGSDHYGMRPDLITIAKGLTSAYAPLSGTIVSETLWNVLVQGSDELGPSATAGPIRPIRSAPPPGGQSEPHRRVGPPRECPRGRRSLPLGAPSCSRKPRHVGEVRGEGLLAAVEFVATATTAASSIRPRRSALASRRAAGAGRHRPRHA